MHANERLIDSGRKDPRNFLMPGFRMRGQARRSEEQTHTMVARLRELSLAPPKHIERFHVAFLDSERRVSGMASFGEGSVTALTMRIRDLFCYALKVEAAAILMAHNHPSGDCRPSQKDIESTNRIAQIAKALDIELLDHLIFSPHGMYSMRKRGEL
ncbi:MAG: JAB domain-containing protein [Pseudomonadota bacterium]